MPRPKKTEKTTEEEKPTENAIENAEIEGEEEPSTVEQAKELANDLEEVSRVLRNMAKNLRGLVRDFQKEIKSLEKKQKKPKDPNRPKRKTGFQKPTPLSAEMCAFLGEAEDKLLPRTEVIRRVNAYIREQNLQNPANRKEIKPDAKLKKLLKGFGKNDTLTYFNMQKYIKHHFPKPPTATDEQ